MNKPSHKLCFICVNYNSKNETIKYIESVKALKGGYEYLIVIIDNSTLDDDYNELASYIEGFPVGINFRLARIENKGYFNALNQGIRLAKKVVGPDTFYIIGNNDITFEKNFVQNLFAIDIKKDELVIAPDVVTNQGSHENPHLRKRVPLLKKLCYDIYYSNYYIAKFISFFKSTQRRFKEHDSQRQYLYMAIGALYVLTPRFFNYFEDLWDEVFLYGEEAVLGAQIRSVNGKILYEPQLICYHNESFTTSKLAVKSKYKIVQRSYRKYRKYL